jgi:hypothetical protein
VLETAKDDFNGGIGHLLSGRLGPDSRAGLVPGYIMAAFIQFLCRFGRFTPVNPEASLDISLSQHAFELRHNRHYIERYAYALLTLHRPLHRRAWSAYMDKANRSYDYSIAQTEQNPATSERLMIQYDTIWKLVDCIEAIDLGVDDEIFKHACTATTNAVHAATRESIAAGDSGSLLRTGSRRLRTLFHSLVGGNSDTRFGTASEVEGSNITPPHIPGPAELHAYVRSLGRLRDYEGLYSFSTWLTKYHAEVTARSKAQYSGKTSLFKTLVALRAALTGYLEADSDHQIRASEDIVQLVRIQIDSVEEWDGWPAQKDVDLYVKGHIKSALPVGGGR